VPSKQDNGTHEAVSAVVVGVVADRDLPAGSVVHDTYGAKGNAQLLSRYGFCIDSNVEPDGSSNDVVEFVAKEGSPAVELRAGPKAYTYGGFVRALEVFLDDGDGGKGHDGCGGDSGGATSSDEPDDMMAFLNQCDEEDAGGFDMLYGNGMDDKESDDGDGDGGDDGDDNDDGGSAEAIKAECTALGRLSTALGRARDRYSLKGKDLQEGLDKKDFSPQYCAAVLVQSERRTLQLFQLAADKIRRRLQGEREEGGSSSSSSSSNEGSDRLTSIQSGKKRMTPSQRDRHIEALRIILEQQGSPDERRENAAVMLTEGAAEMILFAMEQIKLDDDESSSKKKKWNDIMKLKKRSAKLMSECCHCVATLSYYCEDSPSLASTIPAIIDALEQYRAVGNMKLFLRGLEALECLSVQSPMCVVDNGGLETIFNVMNSLRGRKVTKSAALQKSFLLVVHCIASASDETCMADKVAEAKLIPFVIDAMKDHVKDRNVQIAACNAISVLAVTEENSSCIVECGGLKALLAVSGEFLHDVEAQKAVCDAVSWLSEGQTLIQLHATSSGCVERLLEILKTHGIDAMLVEKALTALESFCDNEECRPRFLEAGAAARVEEAMTTFPASEKIQELCQTLLSYVRPVKRMSN